eukprot:TRINITY_DN2806_c0_g1_i3.p1 TRINITY_DN2806_c0_g1~~TRINITY_DN2806_c0_g1_i3.p1  ORF type:complete len:274 (+),score=43.34 TRINITY_DN2806_c0_g1_i3:235-1056(+)
MEAESDLFLSTNTRHFGPSVVAPVDKDAGGIYVLKQVVNPERTHLVTALSDESIRVYDIERELQPLLNLTQAHEKTINQVVIGENRILSCSNDGLVKLWDPRSGELTGMMKNRNKEVYSVSQSRYIVAGGARSEVAFWDVRNLKEMCRFNETFTDDVTRVIFHPTETSMLLAGSEDQVLCLFDLQQQNEEDAMSSTFRADQPISFCDFYGEKLQNAFLVSTVSSIHLIDLQECVSLKDVFPIKYDEMNQHQLIEVTRNDEAKDEIFTVLANEQ